MEVFEIVNLKHGNKSISVDLSDLECKMLLTYAINSLLDRGSLALLTDEDRTRLQGLQELLTTQTQGTA
jgi:hypothetical protein